jgi:hypothetical protein
VLSVLRRYTDSGYPFGMFKIFLPVSLNYPLLIAPSIFFSDGNLLFNIKSNLHIGFYCVERRIDVCDIYKSNKAFYVDILFQVGDERTLV